MNLSLSVVSFVGMFVIMILAAILLRRSNLLPAGNAKVLSTLLMNALLPAHIFSSIASSQLQTPELLAAGVILVSETVTGYTAFCIGRWVLRLDRGAIGALVLAAMFGSSGLLGNTLVKILFANNPAMISVSTVISSIGIGVPLNTIGILIAMYFGTRDTTETPVTIVKRLLVEPCMVAIYAGLTWAMLGWPTSGFVTDMLFGACTISSAALPFCSAFLVGMTLEVPRIGKDAAVITAGLILALIVEPLVAAYLLELFPFAPETRVITLLFASMPASPLSVVMAVRYGCDAELASKLVTATLIVSAITLPIIAML